MSIKIGLLGFGTVASGIPFLLKEMVKRFLQPHVTNSKLRRFWLKMTRKKIVLSLQVTTTILSQMLTKSLTMTRFKSLLN